MEFFAAPQNVPFAIALCLMLGVAVLEGVGLLIGGGFSHLVDGLLPDLDLDVDLDVVDALDVGGDVDAAGPANALTRGLDWLHLGRLPALIWLVLFLTAFGLCGLMAQSATHALLGFLWPAPIAAPLAFFGALPIVRVCGGTLARWLPKDETSAVPSDHLVGRVATIVLGTARSEAPSQARVRDRHGRSHYVMVEPDTPDHELPNGTQVLLVRRDGSRFRAIPAPASVISADASA